MFFVQEGPDKKTTILLSNDLGQRDASDIPIWLPPGLSHVPDISSKKNVWVGKPGVIGPVDTSSTKNVNKQLNNARYHCLALW